jgi:hypothetical protein
MPPWKVILPDRGDAQPKLFDLRSDPHERHDLAAQHPVLVEYARLRAAELQEAPPAEASPPVELDAATRERLRRLGYVVD